MRAGGEVSALPCGLVLPRPRNRLKRSWAFAPSAGHSEADCSLVWCPPRAQVPWVTLLNASLMSFSLWSPGGTDSLFREQVRAVCSGALKRCDAGRLTPHARGFVRV